MFVYILECEDGSYYTGIAKDLEKRLTDHGKGSKYTRAKKPLRLVYVEQSETARKREYEIKQMTRAKKIELLNFDINQVVHYNYIKVS